MHCEGSLVDNTEICQLFIVPKTPCLSTNKRIPTAVTEDTLSYYS